MAEYIKREDVIDAIENFLEMDKYYHPYSRGKIIPISEMVSRVNELPTADVVPVEHGKWIYDENGYDWNIPAWRCSECDVVNSNLPTFCGKEKLHLFVGSKFCPNCGARMDGEDNG